MYTIVYLRFKFEPILFHDYILLLKVSVYYAYNMCTEKSNSNFGWALSDLRPPPGCEVKEVLIHIIFNIVHGYHECAEHGK